MSNLHRIRLLATDGRDHVFTGQESEEGGSVDVLAVSGTDGETVYLEIAQADGSVIASHLPYVLHDDDGTVDGDGKIVGVVSVTPASGVSLDGARVRVYENRAQTRLRWEGMVTMVYARLERDGGATEVPLALRTLRNGESRAFSPPLTIERDATYALAGDAPETDGGHAVYRYSISEETPASVDGHISYYDVKNPSSPIKVDTVAGIGRGTTREVDIPDIVSADGHDYRTMQLTDRVTLAYPGATEYSVQCLELVSPPAQGGTYKATINYVSSDGRDLGISDSVIVDRRYLYTPPARLHVRGDAGRVTTYSLSASNDLGSGGAIELVPGQTEGQREIDVAYDPMPDDAERSWTVVLVNGSVAPNDPAREIRRITYRGHPGQTARHATEAAIDVDGTKFVPAAFSAEAYEHTFGGGDAQIDQAIYYVPDGWAEPEPYEVKVNYVNIATNGVISSETYTAAPTMRHDLEMETPASFDRDGVEYVRLDGQELAIMHSFYSPNRTYNVYYRDTNDDLHAKTVIRSFRVEYLDPETGDTVRRPTTAPLSTSSAGDAGNADAGAAGNDATTGAAGGGAAAGTPPAATPTPAGTTPAPTRETPGDTTTITGIGTDRDVVSIVDDGTPRGLVTNDGTDLATVRIEDNETPLTQSPDGKDTPAPSIPVGAAIGIGAGAAVAIAALVIFLVKRRGGDNDTPSDGRATA